MLGNLILATLVAAATLPAAQTGSANAAGSAGSPPASQTSATAAFAGSEACQTCHEDIFKAFLKNPHHVVEANKKRGWEGRTCEACHGPGAKHAESASADDIRNPSKLKAAETDRICLGCHKNRPSPVGRIVNGHARQQVGCTSCHGIHDAARQLGNRNAAKVNQQCASCHSSVWAQFQRPHRHKLPEGAMSCIDCHNPHGAPLPRAIQATAGNEPGCYKCHTDKRGPFAFEHAPVRLEGCGTCHEAHGSANPRMLTRHEVRFQCLECHSNLPQPKPAAAAPLGGTPPGIHDLRSPRYRNCTICHMKIHGSHVNRDFLR